ncbi:MAG: mannose-6-phosphate isomerase, class I [Jatrophihabitans sp.]
MSPPRIIALDNPIRDYAWGSATHIPQLLGIPATGRPAAELWIGAHPDSPSRWADPTEPIEDAGVGLDALIAAAPAELLGPQVLERFGARLPFLVKVLAADRALSMQVHPDLVQARAGYAAEQQAGLAPDSPERNYSDPNHKPELAYALTDFDAFCGFRPVAQTAQFLDALAVAELAHYRELLLAEGGLRATFTCLLTLRGDVRDALVAATLAGCRRLAAEDGRWAAPARAVLLAGADFPGDVGAVLALLLNYVRLAPGEAIFLGAGNVHAYLRGACVEVLANSDNVLRCGLTGKHVDVPELLRIADFSPLPEPRWQPATDRPTTFELPVPDFTLTVTMAGVPLELAGRRPHLVLGGERRTVLRHGDELVELAPWHAAFVAAGPGGSSVRAEGRAFVVSTAAEAGAVS